MSRHLPSYKALFLVACAAAILFVSANPAFAQQQTLGQMTKNLYSSTVHVQTFLSLLSYILGVFFSITGLLALRAHVEDPGRNPLNAALLRMGAAAFFIFTPTFANFLVGTLGEAGQSNMNFVNTAGPGDIQGQGLEVALNRLVSDIAPALLDYMVPFVAYAAGVVFMLIGLKRLALATGDGPQAPGGMGTMGTFFVAAALMSFGYFVGALEGSIFGTTTIYNSPTFMGQADGDLVSHANHAMWGVFIFLRIVGYISVLRALFMLRAAGEGGNVSMMVVGTHMVAGAMLINATGFVIAIQNSFVDPAHHILSGG